MFRLEMYIKEVPRFKSLGTMIAFIYILSYMQWIATIVANEIDKKNNII